MRELTPRQSEVLRFIERTVTNKGYPPSVREIGDAVGLRSSSTVHGHLGRLEALGYIRRDPSKPRAIELLRFQPGGRPDGNGRVVEVPLIGRIAAGSPILALEHVEETFPLPWSMLRGGSCFLLKVKGDSMVDAGIHDGDMVLVREQPTANNGEIVAALIEDEATVKRFYRERNFIRLVAENPAYRPIESQNVRILGKVVGLIRMFS